MIPKTHFPITGDERYDDKFLSNFVNINIIDELRRIPGVGDASNMGEKKYSIRVWMDPDRIKSLGLSPNDVVSAIQSQNKQAAIGRIGSPPPLKTSRLSSSSPQFDASLLFDTRRLAI
jgi:multidrug efflux pump subunit AcrB